MTTLARLTAAAKLGESCASLALAVALLASAGACSHKEAQDERYYLVLDEWVTQGGPVDRVQSTVVPTCGKLVMQTATLTEQATLTTTRRADFDFRVDVCVKMTVHRAYPQPEFSNQETVRILCDESEVGLYKPLCVRARLR